MTTPGVAIDFYEGPRDRRGRHNVTYLEKKFLFLDTVGK